MTRRRVDRRPRALRDLADIALFLAERSEHDDLALRFLAAAETSFEKLAAMPYLGAPWQSRDPRLGDVRRWRISGFAAYQVFYRTTATGIEIIRVIHGKRDIDGQFRGPDSQGLAEPRVVYLSVA